MTYPIKVKILCDSTSEAFSKGDIIIEDDVWIGYGATILSGVHIGQGAIIASRALITKDVPPYSIVGGVPAKVLKYRLDDNMVSKMKDVNFKNIDVDLFKTHLIDFYMPFYNKNIDWLPKKNLKKKE